MLLYRQVSEPPKRERDRFGRNQERNTKHSSKVLTRRTSISAGRIQRLICEALVCGMSRLYSYMDDVGCRTRTVTAVCSGRARKRHPSSLPHLLWMSVFHRLCQAARVLAVLWALLLLSFRKLVYYVFGRSQRSMRKVWSPYNLCVVSNIIVYVRMVIPQGYSVSAHCTNGPSFHSSSF